MAANLSILNSNCWKNSSEVIQKEYLKSAVLEVKSYDSVLLLQMLGTARGVSLGLGKINLAALDSSLPNRDGYLRARRKREKNRHKITTKKYVHIEVKLLKHFLLISA